MSLLTFTSSYLCPSTYQQFRPVSRLRLRTNFLHRSCHSLHCHSHHSVGPSSIRYQTLYTRRSVICASNQPEEGFVAVADFEDLDEKDWSFLEEDSINSKEEHDRKIDKVISVANIVDSSKVLISVGSDDFVDRLVESSPCQLLVAVHDSFLSLACIKEKHDKVKCWQGELLSVPKKWAPFDVVFLYFLPSLPFKFEDTFRALAKRCAPGARVVISHLQGRQGLQQQRQQYSDIVVSDLPEMKTLEQVASDHSFLLKEFIDDHSNYLAVLEFEA